MYHDGITDKEEWFFFGVVLDENSDPILGTGKCEKEHENKNIKCCTTSHLNLMLTSLKLMENVEKEGLP